MMNTIIPIQIRNEQSMIGGDQSYGLQGGDTGAPDIQFLDGTTMAFLDGTTAEFLG